MATNATGTLREPAVSLSGDHVVLRPMTEGDWDSLERWNNDPEVLWFSEGDDVRSRPLEEVKRIYRMVSQTAYCFIIEVEGRGIGECWLQEMNLDRILARNPGRYCRRIDICIGEKELWDQGYGTEAIRLLAAFGFEKEDADLIFGCSIADYNSRSLRAFEKVGFQVDQWVQLPDGGKGNQECDQVLTREDYFST